MKKSLLLLAGVYFLMAYPLVSQGLLNKVKNAVAKEVIGTNGGGSNSSTQGSEPACACSNASLIADLNKVKIDYTEISISMKDDGSLLLRDRIGGKYHIVKNGVAQGPYSENDPRVKEFDVVNEDAISYQDADAWVKRYPGYITRSGEKYLIKFSGKNFGPYAIINDFAVSKSRDKFAAIITENILVTEDMGKKMEEAIKNAKTDQERMEIAMKFGQQMQNQMQQGGGTESLQPKLISNISGANYDPETWIGGRLNGSVKFNDILVIAPDRIMDLQGKTVMKLSQNSYSTKDMFVNSSNTRYASYDYGTLTFSDNTTLSDLFYPHLVKTAGKVYLAYMYYSPGKNAIMQCAIPF